MVSKNAKIFFGNIIHTKNRYELEIIENGYIIIIDTKIQAVGEQSTIKDARARLCLSSSTPSVKLGKSQILIPGFVDTHLHAPQYPHCGLGYDRPVMERLTEHLFPLEAKFTNAVYSRKVYEALVKKTISCGTTTACYYGSLYLDSCNILIDILSEMGQRALVGIANMTINTPPFYTENSEESLVKTREFIKYVQSKKSDLLRTIISPRSAYFVDKELMIQLAGLAKCKNLHIQTHLSHQLEEVTYMEANYGMPYANVYDQCQLLTNKTIAIHGLHLSDKELMLLSRRRTSIAHCPGSNLCLKSGAMDIRKLWDFGITVGLGTDICSGPHPSMIRTMQAAFFDSIGLSFQTQQPPLDTFEAFYLATLGGAQALSLEKDIGSFEVNKEFDALVVDGNIEMGLGSMMEFTPQEIFERFVYCGDDRNIVAIYVSGKLVKGAI